MVQDKAILTVAD